MSWSTAKDRMILNEIPKDVEKDMQDFLPAVNDNVDKSLVTRWIENLKENMKWDFAKHTARKLKDKGDGSAYLIGAGPSLDDDYQYLKDKKTIIATSHSLKFLLSKGIKPDYVVVVSSGIGQVNFLNVDEKITLISDICVHPDVLNNWKGDVFFFKSVDNKEVNVLTDFDVNMSSGGNSGGAAYMLASGMGFKRIVFVGMDLANRYDKHISYCGDMKDKGEKDDPMLTIDIQGKAIYTLAKMYVYKYFIDMCSLKFKAEHINCSFGIIGAYLQGNLKSIKQQSLQEVN